MVTQIPLWQVALAEPRLLPMTEGLIICLEFQCFHQLPLAMIILNSVIEIGQSKF